MPIPQGFQRAQLEIDGAEPIPCAFNPQSYTVTKTNVWNFKPTTGVDLPDGEFGGGLPRRTTLTLLLDVSLQPPDQSVKDTANQLLKMMETGGGGGGGGAAPPFVTFRWGSVDLPKSVPVSLTIQFALFHPNGEPRRATVDLELAQAEKASTASGSGTSKKPEPHHPRHGRHARAPRARRRLAARRSPTTRTAIPTRWRPIAEANGIDDPLRLPRGTDLTIPGLD